MECPKCKTNLNEGARFCGQCGHSIPGPDSESVQAEDLFDLKTPSSGSNLKVSKSNQPQDLFDLASEEDEDEFMDLDAPPNYQESLLEEEKEDLFEEELPPQEEENPLTQDLEDDRKVFSAEDDPTALEEEKQLEAKKIDSQTLKKARKSLKQKDKRGFALTGLLSFFMLTLLSIACIALAFAMKDSPSLMSVGASPVIILFGYFFLRKKGFLLAHANSILLGLLGIYLLYCTLLAHRGILPEHLFQSVNNGFTTSLSWSQALNFYLLVLLQTTLYWWARIKFHPVFLISYFLVCSFCLSSLFLVTSESLQVLDPGTVEAPVAKALEHYLGGLSLYFTPYYVLTHLFLPVLIMIGFIQVLLNFIRKKKQNSLLFFLMTLNFFPILTYLLYHYQRKGFENLFQISDYLEPLYQWIKSLPTIT